MLYVVEALRWGDRENHSYIVGVFDDKLKAVEASLAEEFWRGGKYNCVIKECVLNAVNEDAVNDFRSGYIESKEEIDRMIEGYIVSD